MSQRRIQLVQSPIAVYNPYASLAFRFTVLAQNAYLMDVSVFKVLARPTNPNNPTQPTTTYLGVCTPGDMNDLPTTPPADTTQPYRTNFIDLTFDTETDASSGWTDIQSGVTTLVNALNATDLLGSGNSVWIGTPPG